jgi:hypothetical protein
MIEVFKILKGFDFEEVDYSKFSTLATDSRRGHNLKLYKTRFNNNLGKFAFSNRVVDTWNDLPEMVVSCKIVNNFKSKLDQYFKEMSGVYIS